MVQGQDKKIIAVMGATGNQGGAVVDALLTASDKFAVRAITRNPSSEKAIALEARGVEVVKGDADDVPSMVAAFSGAYGAFLVTNFWADMDMFHEMETTQKLQEAVLEAKVEHVVLSSLEDTRPIINASKDKDTWPVLEEKNGSYVPHLDGKGEIGKQFLESDVPVTLLITSAYYENLINYGWGPQKQQEEGQPLAVSFPWGDKPVFWNSLRDIGCNVLAILEDPSTINSSVGVASEYLTGKDIADAFSEVIGVPVVYNAIPTEVYASFGFPGAAELANMFRFNVDFKPVYRDVAENEKRLGRKTDKVIDYIKENKAFFEPAADQTDIVVG